MRKPSRNRPPYPPRREPSDGADRFDAAAARLLGGDPHAARPSDIQDVSEGVRLLIARRFPSVDAEEVAQETSIKVLEIRRHGRADALANPASFVTRMALNCAVDVTRRQSREDLSGDLDARRGEPTDGVADDENEIARLIDRLATGENVAAAVDLALSRRDFVTVRVVTAWLDLAHERGRAPSSREVAPRVNASHTTINSALAQFREYMALVA